MKFGVGFDFGWCGFGFSGGLFPELRLGLVRVFAWRGSLIEHMRVWRHALDAKLDALKRETMK